MSEEQSEKEINYPAPMSADFLNRSLVNPWRRTDSLDCVDTEVPISQLWTQQQQQMYELQEISKARGSPDATAPSFASPYPQ